MGTADRGHFSVDTDRVEVPGARVVFGAAFALMVLNFADRHVVVAAFPQLEAEWGASDVQLGALVSVVSVTVALGALPAALLVDRWSRVRAIAVMASVWSVAAAAAGLAQSYGQLFTARAAVGAGEAGYGPAAGALLATIFPAGRRATVLGAFQAAASLGAMLGVALGGVVAVRWGWRAAFVVVALPGLAVALLFLRFRDYPTVRLGGPTGASSARRIVGELFRARSGTAAYMGGAVQLMVVSTLYTWLPSQFRRVYGMPLDRAAGATALVILAGFGGMIAFAYVADRAAARNPPARLLVPAVLAMVSGILLVTAFAAVGPGAVQFLLVVAGGATMTAASGPVAAVVVDVVHPALRATAISTMAAVGNLLGLAVGPILGGWLSDLYGLTTALTVMPLLCLVSAATLWYGSRSYKRDRYAVPVAPVPSALGLRPQEGHP
jgi:predicted MFS family arabinose efflux permease